MEALPTLKILTKPLVFKPQRAQDARDMSRPQLQPYVQGASSTGAVVNGGLIDFQDNMQRGVPEYGITPSMIAAQQQMQQANAMMPAGMMSQMQVMTPGMFSHMQPGMMTAGMGGMPVPGMQNVNTTAMPFPGANCHGVPAGNAGWVSGPASYHYVNGVLYAPVGDPVASAVKTVQPDEAETTEAAAPSTVREEDTGKRVTRQVQAYMRKKSKDTFCMSSGGGGGGGGGGGNSRKQQTANTAEEVAAARVNSLNAAMPKGTSKVDASIRGRW
jgi:hypothetical protein